MSSKTYDENNIAMRKNAFCQPDREENRLEKIEICLIS